MRWPSRTETIGMNSKIGRCGILFVVVSCSFAAMLGDHVLAAWIRLRRSPGSRALSSISLDFPSQILRRFQLAFHESFVDDHLYADIGDFFLLPTFYLLAQRLKVPLHAVNGLSRNPHARSCSANKRATSPRRALGAIAGFN